ncbi:hypothetical protein C1645_736599 [Glomus cerebriforme]|uniref:Uncharacterized protein n=1 Tax=Glomus cerebriforme TaxID=658196 RepID=A0A397T703_9GLOM|nr:hypothetical protein C1645_736599 [Glomus cerebriforme]
MTVLENANAEDFDDAYKCEILKSMMGGKYAPVSLQNPFVNPAVNINSPDTLRAWIRTKYQRETVGNQQSAIHRLTQEKFQSYDTPDTYETRIRPLLLGVTDNDAQVLGFLKSQLSGDFYTWMRIANPAAQPAQVHPQNNEASANFEKLNSKVTSLESQLAESMQVHSKLAQHLQLLENVVNSNNASIFNSYINQELEKRLGVIEINLAKLSKFVREDTIDTKSAHYQCLEFSDYNNGGLEKRLKQIEAHLAKFARKDTRGTKTPQHQRLKSSPFGGLEKRLGQIEALLAKLAKDFKSRSDQVHMVTVDDQSDLIFSDDNTSKPEDNDYNSDNSSAGSDSRNRDMNIYISHGNGKKK